MRDLAIYVPLCVLSLVVHSALPPAAVLLRPSPDAELPHGRYVEARTASVFAGACHYGAEYTTTGREALLAWHFDGGSWHGVDLTGSNVVLAVAGEENLAEAAGAKSAEAAGAISAEAAGAQLAEAAGAHSAEAAGSRHSLVYTDAQSSPERRAASVDFVLAQCRALAGEVRGVKCTELRVAIEGESFAVAAPGHFELAGSLLENRECCKMPYDVWYAPFVDVVHPLVGCNAVFNFEDRALGPIWKRHSQNETFVARFGSSARSSSACSAETAHAASGFEPSVTDRKTQVTKEAVPARAGPARASIGDRG